MFTLDGNLSKLKIMKLVRKLLYLRMLILMKLLRKTSGLHALTQQVNHSRNFLRVVLQMKRDL